MPSDSSAAPRHFATTVACVIALAAMATGCRPQEGSGAAATNEQVRRGQVLLAQYQCGSCHSIPEVVGARAESGPSLAAFGQRSYIAGHLPNRPDTLARWIADPNAMVPGTLMPSMGVSMDDARAMSAYLLSLE